jgi:hypothetical protein
MHQRDVRGDVGQVQRLLDRGIAPADHGDLLAAIEEAIAGGAGRDALAAKGFLGRQAEIFGRSAGRDDQRIAGVFAVVPNRRNGRWRSSTRLMWSSTMSVLNRSACRRMRSIS